MFTNPINIIVAVEKLFKDQSAVINKTVKQFQPGNSYHFFRGMRASLPNSAFPSLEVEATDCSSQHMSTQTMTSTYSFDFTLTTCTDNASMSLEYITTLSRIFLEILAHPANRGFEIPYEKQWNPQQNALCPARVSFGEISSANYNSNKEGTIRVATWQWTATVLEGFHPGWQHQGDIIKMPHYPHELEPIE